MKILFDSQIFSVQKFGGISNYFANIITNSQKNTSVQLPYMYTNNVYLKEIGINYQDLLSYVQFKGKNRIKALVNKIFNIKSIKFDEYDIFHPTYYDDYFTSYLSRDKPFVITVYDMIHELFPQYFDQNSMEYRTKKVLCQKANKIIAISEHTKQDIIRLFGIPESKIKVIHLSTDFKLINQPSMHIQWLPEQYLLFVGTRFGYKNFDWMLTSIAPILKQTNVKIVVIGNELNDHEQKLVMLLDLEHLIVVNNVSSSHQLQEIYNRAELFIFPSLYEGFGIPTLEAFASKVPVLLTNSSCFPEIAQDAALYFEPNDISDFQAKVKLVLNSPSKRQDLIERGVRRLHNFSWQNTADETYKLYTELI